MSCAFMIGQMKSVAEQKSVFFVKQFLYREEKNCLILTEDRTHVNLLKPTRSPLWIELKVEFFLVTLSFYLRNTFICTYFTVFAQRQANIYCWTRDFNLFFFIFIVVYTTYTVIYFTRKIQFFFPLGILLHYFPVWALYPEPAPGHMRYA